MESLFVPGNPVWTEAQHVINPLHRILANLSFISLAFWNLISVSTIRWAGLFSSHMRYIASSLLKNMFSFRMLVLKRNGGMGYFENFSQCSHIL